MNDSLLVIVLAQAILYGTPLLYASLGELLAERSGVLNLGVEGMMLVGAAMGFWGMQRAPGPEWLVLLLAVLTAAFAGLVMSSIFAFLAVTLRASQIVSGLALTIFAGGLGLSSYLGNDLKLADVPAKHQFSEIDRLTLHAKHIFSASTHRRDEHHFVAITQRIVRSDIVLVDGVEQPNAWDIELGKLFLQTAPQIGHCGAFAEFLNHFGGPGALAQDRKELHANFHFPWSCETIWRISGRISFSIAKLTAPFDPGSEINTLPRAVPAAARLIIAAEPMSR